jgi:hypothetical protein
MLVHQLEQPLICPTLGLQPLICPTLADIGSAGTRPAADAMVNQCLVDMSACEH